MNSLVRIIREIHRRSLWQVLAMYLAGSWVAIQVVGQLTQTAGLPDWVPPFALVLLVLGLPVVLATALVQEASPGRSMAPAADAPPAGTSPQSDPDPQRPPPADSGPSPSNSSLSRFLTWKRTVLAGVLAFTILGTAVAGYFVMRIGGFGPAASLVAQGVIEDGEPIVLADFRNATADSHLGSVVSEALRIDLSESPALRVVERGQVQGTLRRMERDEEATLTAELAREVAMREGVSAYLEGEVAGAGTGFIFSATLRSSEDGAALASFRRTARNEEGVIEAIDRLSQDIRERAGESLRSIRRAGALHQVTTSSLEALRLYSEAERVAAAGREGEALVLMEEAVDLDPEFAMAWRKIAVLHDNLGIDPQRARFATVEAHRLGDRLTALERGMAEAFHATLILDDVAATVRAYERVLRIDPDHPAALNNLGLGYIELGRFDEAEEVLTHAATLPREGSGLARFNLVRLRLLQGDPAAARAEVAGVREAAPDDPRVMIATGWVHARALEFDAAMAEVEAYLSVTGPARIDVGSELWITLMIASGHPNGAVERIEQILAQPDLAPRARLPTAGLTAWVLALGHEDPEAMDSLVDREAERLRESGGDDAELTRLAATLHLQAGDRARASRWLEPDDDVDDDDDVQADGSYLPGRAPPASLIRRWHSGQADPVAVLEDFQSFAQGPDCHRCVDDILPILFEEAGQLDRALAAWEDLAENPLPHLAYGVVIVPIALEQAGRLAEATGDRQAALGAYRRLLALWHAAGPELEPRVRHAQTRISELEAGAAGQS
ncbi:MAG: hypothetical protein EA351_12265 [Gemmatimonadales bacterium]|nr:MAG: hypothetical protein EA351_12265 [Gemmatimonadales bacterium]